MTIVDFEYEGYKFTYRLDSTYNVLMCCIKNYIYVYDVGDIVSGEFRKSITVLKNKKEFENNLPLFRRALARYQKLKVLI